MSRIAELARTHLLKALAATFAGGGLLGTGITAYVALQQGRIERFETRMTAEYQAVATAKRELYQSVDKFTKVLASGKRPPQALVDDISQKLLDLHQRVDVFAVGLAPDEQQKLTRLKMSLANMKVEVARARTKADLEFLAGSVGQLEAAYKAARPIVEKNIGVPVFTG